MSEKIKSYKARKPDIAIQNEFNNNAFLLPFNDFIFKSIASKKTPWDESVALAQKVFTTPTLYGESIVAETMYALLLRMQRDNRGRQPAEDVYEAWLNNPTSVPQLTEFKESHPKQMETVNRIFFKRIIHSKLLHRHTLSTFGLNLAVRMSNEAESFEPMIQIHHKLMTLGGTITQTANIPHRIHSIGSALANRDRGDDARRQRHLFTSRLAAARISILNGHASDALDNLELTGISDPKLVAELTREIWELVLTSRDFHVLPGYFSMVDGKISKFEADNMPPMMLDMLRLSFARALMKRDDAKGESTNATYIQKFAGKLMSNMQVLNDGLAVNTLINQVYGNVDTYILLLLERGRKEGSSFAPALTQYFEEFSKKLSIGEAELKTLMFRTFFNEVISAIRGGQAVPLEILHFMKEEHFDTTRYDRFLKLFNAIIHAVLQDNLYEPVPKMTGKQYLDKLLSSDEVIKLTGGFGSRAYLTLNNQVRLLIAKQRGKLKTLRGNEGTIYRHDPDKAARSARLKNPDGGPL